MDNSKKSLAMGSLTVHPDNKRYFTDGSGKAVYLTGSHTWDNFQDMDIGHRHLAHPWKFPVPFDYSAYLDWMIEHNHNFMRFWYYENAFRLYFDTGEMPTNTPVPYKRTGPGIALDGKPKFDLNQWNEEFFDRLSDRIAIAGERGIYVGFMLFQGFSTNKCDDNVIFDPWKGHPFNKMNNINGIDGDIDGDDRGNGIHTMRSPQIVALQEAYVAKVIDTVNHLDNVLYEIINEARIETLEWQYHMINFIKRYQSSKPKKHLVWMSAHMDDGNKRGRYEDVINSPADCISPCIDDGHGDWLEDPPASDGTKPIICDTDHFWGVGGDFRWVWKTFCRGNHPIFMDNLKDKYYVEFFGAEFDMKSARIAMGDTKRYADRMDLVRCLPLDSLSSTRYCLAEPGVVYTIYKPSSDQRVITVELEEGAYDYEWFDPYESRIGETGMIKTAKGLNDFESAADGDRVLFIRRHGK